MDAKTKEIVFLQGCVAFGEAKSSSQTWMEQLEKVHEELETISHTPLTFRSGPVCSQLDAVLDKHAITPQSYHSCLFTGNQCNNIYLSNLGNNWQKWMQKQKEIAFLQGCVAFGEAKSSSQTWMEQLEKVHEELETISHTPLTFRSGPVCSQLDAVLDKHAITPQSYHSCSFTGNQCNNIYTHRF
ncbi:hypothetical protein PoB_006073500 [Plakobranchus ocellatus]|uniref:Uncharacterized protein n=1 Tax=Plakobranchus ocellatus TaxID=259542 RepID=A0AAV4CQP9_9GAST|nr:hypothetical protein PoB_006073500 [Plakobranchus ocellatus]